MKLLLSFAVAFLVMGVPAVFGQQGPVKTKIFYPKDSMLFEKATGFNFHDEIGFKQAKFGKTTMIIQAQSSAGDYYFVFKKKIKTIDHQEEHIQDVYGTLPDGTYGVVGQDTVQPVTLTDHNLYAFIFVADHGGLLEKARFQDFGNAVYWPAFDYKNCLVADEDGDGFPEFYLSYYGDSDGLDAKPYRQLVYYFNVPHTQLVKGKATAFYPAGNEEDVYHIEYNQSWKAMPNAVQQKSKTILSSVSIEF